MILVGPFQLRMFYDSVICPPCPEQGELSPWGCREQEVSAHLPPSAASFHKIPGGAVGLPAGRRRSLGSGNRLCPGCPLLFLSSK